MNGSLFYSQSKGKHTLLLGSFLVLVAVLTFDNYTNYTNYIIYPIWALWMAYILWSTIHLSKDEHTFIVVSFLFLMIYLLYWVIGYSSTEVGQVLRDCNWILSGIVAVYAMKLFSERELRVVYLFIITVLIILVFVLIKAGINSMAAGEENDAATVASAWYGSLFMLLSGLSLTFFLNVKRFFPRIISLFVLILTIYLNVVIMQRSTNVIFMIAELGLILVFVLKRKPIIIMLSVFIIGLAIYAFSTSSLLIGCFDWLAKVSPSERMSMRFNEISTALFYENIEAGGGSMSARNNLMSVSWNTFTSSPGHFVFGAGDGHGYTIIGGHSFFLDTLARFGIIGGCLVFIYFIKQYQVIFSFLDKNKQWALYMQCAIVFVFYVLRNFYGAISYGLSNMVILVLFPLTFQIIQYYTNKQKKLQL